MQLPWGVVHLHTVRIGGGILRVETISLGQEVIDRTALWLEDTSRRRVCRLELRLGSARSPAAKCQAAAIVFGANIRKKVGEVEE